MNSTVGSISPRLALALTVFTLGLFVLSVLVVAGLLIARRRRVAVHQDYVVRLLHNSAVPLAIQLIVRAIDLGFGIVLYRVLEAHALANFVFAAFVATVLLATIAEWGLNIYLTREVARDPQAIERTFGTSLAIRLVFAVLVIPVSVGVAQLYNGLEAAQLIRDGINREGVLLLLILGSTVLPGAFSAAVSALFMATERPIVPAVAQLLTNIVSALLKIGALVLGLGIIGVALAALLATLFSTIVFVRLLVGTWGWIRLRFDRHLASTMLRAGWPLMLNSLLLAVFFRFDITIIRAFRADELAAYDAAYKYVNLTQILPPIVINAVFPLFTRQAASDRLALSRAYSYLTRLLLLLALPITVGVTVIARSLIAVYDLQYAAVGTPALQLLIWYLPLSYVNGVTQYALIALDRPKTITYAFGAAAMFNLIFNLVFVPLYGVKAAAVATVLSEVVLFWPLWRVLQQELQPQPLWAVVWRPLIAALVMGLAMLALAPVHVVLSIMIAPPIFWLLLVLLGAVQDEDRRLVRRVLRRAS